MTERKSQNHKRMQVSPHTIFQAIGHRVTAHLLERPISSLCLSMVSIRLRN